jgi:hypothetical protein
MMMLVRCGAAVRVRQCGSHGMSPCSAHFAGALRAIRPARAAHADLTRTQPHHHSTQHTSNSNTAATAEHKRPALTETPSLLRRGTAGTSTMQVSSRRSALRWRTEGSAMRQLAPPRVQTLLGCSSEAAGGSSGRLFFRVAAAAAVRRRGSAAAARSAARAGGAPQERWEAASGQQRPLAPQLRRRSACRAGATCPSVPPYTLRPLAPPRPLTHCPHRCRSSSRR